MLQLVLMSSFGLALLTVSFQAATGQEIQVKLEDCPKAVQRTIRREATGGKIVEIEKETDANKTVYEAEILIDGKEYEVTVNQTGTLLSKVLESEHDDEEDEQEEQEQEEHEQEEHEQEEDAAQDEGHE